MKRPQESGDLFFSREWQEGNSSFRVCIDSEFMSITRFYGKGTMNGTRAFMDALDEGRSAVPDNSKVRAILDLSELQGAPLRAQLLLSKWLAKNKGEFRSIAVFGGKPWEMKFAKAITKLAGFRNVGFFDEEEAAIVYTNQ